MQLLADAMLLSCHVLLRVVMSCHVMLLRVVMSCHVMLLRVVMSCSS
jgi:hypothetical protein